MLPLTRADIVGPAAYEGMRDDLRRRVIEHKRDRRIDVGPLVTIVFENRLTLRFQVEEMLRTERITDASKIQEELDVYNQMMPRPDSLSATLLIAVPRDADPRAELDRLVGLDEHVALHIGPHRVVRAAFEPGRATADRIAAVQYLRFPIDADARAALRAPGAALAVEVDHPAYTHTAAATEAMRASLARDLDD